MTSIRFRAATRTDVPALLELSNAADRGWWGQDETDEDEVAQLLRLADDLQQRTRVVETAEGLAASAIRFAAKDTAVAFDPALAPAVRREVEDRLLTWLATAGVTELDAPAHDGPLLAAYARHGFLPASSSFELERSPRLAFPPAELPEGLQVRPFDRSAHAAPVHALLYRFWTEVPTHEHRDLEEWRELFLGHASFDPHLQVVAWRGEDPVGAAICRVYTDDAGWVMQLGVAPEERGRGLGRALLVEAGRRLAAVHGVATVGLSVVARNAGALGLYRSVGFEVTREWVSCSRRPRSARSDAPEAVS
jgi:ribosomal protein S18 acetylase RimI-like enzyme